MRPFLICPTVSELLTIEKGFNTFLPDFHANALIFGLQGSFIYNLTIELAKQPDPLIYLKSFLGLHAFSLFESVLRSVLAHSERSFKNCSGDNGVLPKIGKMQNCSSEPTRHFVRSSYGLARR